MALRRSGLWVLLLFGIFAIGVLVHNHFYISSIEAENPQAGSITQVNYARTHVIRKGDAGPPVMLIHGAGANAREFNLTLVPQLSETHQLIIPDRPGHGYSERVADAQTLAVQAAQMGGVLEQTSGTEPAVIVGHSYGTAVALRLALDRPDLVKGLVLLAPVSHDWGPEKVAWFNSLATVPVLGAGFRQLMPIFGPAQARAGMGHSFSPAPEPEGFYDEAGVGLLFRPTNFHANAQELTALRDELIGQQDRYRELQMPVAIAYGSADMSMDPTIHVEGLRQQVRDLELLAFPSEGHIPHYRQAESVAKLIAHMASDPLPEPAS